MKGKNVMVEDRPTFMLLDIFPNFMPLAKSQWQEIIYMETKKPMEKERPATILRREYLR
jgi:hypothetical protein